MTPPAVTHLYAVTAAHVVNAGGSILRINTRDKQSRSIDLSPDEWLSVPSWEDIAVIDITERVLESDGISYIPLETLITKEFVASVSFGIGEDGFMLGLFGSHAGKARNMVAARFGNVSLLADDGAPVNQGETGIISPCHIFDMHSRTGFSGSPVFVYRTPAGDLRDPEGDLWRKRHLKEQQRLASHYATAAQYRSVGIGRPQYTFVPLVDTDWVFNMDEQHNTFLKMLGIHVGQFHENMKIRKTGSTALEEDDIVRDGNTVRYPSSMTIVVPAWQILELL